MLAQLSPSSRSPDFMRARRKNPRVVQVHVLEHRRHRSDVASCSLEPHIYSERSCAHLTEEHEPRMQHLEGVEDVSVSEVPAC